MTRVSHASVTRLRGTLVAASLKMIDFTNFGSKIIMFLSYLEANLSISALSDLLLREVSLVLCGHLGTNLRSSVVRVLLGGSAKGVQAQGDLK